MSETIRLGEIAIAVTRKDIKHVHLSVHPPGGRVGPKRVGGVDVGKFWARGRKR